MGVKVTGFTVSVGYSRSVLEMEALLVSYDIYKYVHVC